MTLELIAENQLLREKVEKYEKAIEDIKAEIVRNRDEWIKGNDAEWHTYDRCLGIIDKHIGGGE